MEFLCCVILSERFTSLRDNSLLIKNSGEKIHRIDDSVIIQIATDPQLEKPKSLRVFSANNSTLLRDCELSLSALTVFAGVWFQNPFTAVTLPYHYQPADSPHGR